MELKKCINHVNSSKEIWQNINFREKLSVALLFSMHRFQFIWALVWVCLKGGTQTALLIKRPGEGDKTSPLDSGKENPGRNWRRNLIVVMHLRDKSEFSEQFDINWNSSSLVFKKMSVLNFRWEMIFYTNNARDLPFSCHLEASHKFAWREVQCKAPGNMSVKISSNAKENKNLCTW